MPLTPSTSSALPRPGPAGLLLALALASTAQAQRPDSARADSIRRADSLALARELGAPADTLRRAGPGVDPRVSRLLPDISVVGDIVADASPDGSTQEGGHRIAVREIELGAIAAVDPYFRGTVYLGLSETEGISIEQAFLTTSSLPWGLEARIGRILMPVGKLNTTHRHDLHTVDFPWVLKRFLGEEGLKGTGIYLSKVFSPFGFYQELQLTAVDRFGEAPEGLVTNQPPNQNLDGLGYSARLRNYFDLTAHANLEISATAITGLREQPIVSAGGLNAVNARQTVLGADLTYRWRPLQRGLYRSFILQAEVLRQLNQGRSALPAGLPPSAWLGPTRGVTGAYLFARYQLARRTYLGGRWDMMQDPEADGATLKAASGYLQFFPSEFSKILAGVERIAPGEGSAYTRFLMQATFALGPHRPHPF